MPYRNEGMSEGETINFQTETLSRCGLPELAGVQGDILKIATAGLRAAVGEHGIPIRDELDLVLQLRAPSGPLRVASGRSPDRQ